MLSFFGNGVDRDQCRFRVGKAPLTAVSDVPPAEASLFYGSTASSLHLIIYIGFAFTLPQLKGRTVAERARSLGVAGMVALAEGYLRTSMNEVPPTEVVGHILDV